MSEELSGAVAADPAPVIIPAATANEPVAPVNPREAAAALGKWRADQAKKPATEPQPTAAPAATDPQPKAADSAQPEPAAPAEPTEAIDPAETPPIDPPRSWTKDAVERWQSLPRETQEYLAGREQEREREVRRVQNEAAETRKATEAERVQTLETRKKYEAALANTLQSLHLNQQGQFSDIKTVEDVRRLAVENPARYVEWDAQQKDLAAKIQEAQQLITLQQQERADNWAKFAAAQDAEFTKLVPDMKEPAKAEKLINSAVEMMQERGYTDEEINALWNNAEFFRDHRMQSLLLDAARYREAQAKLRVKPAVPVPPVLRPGAAPSKGAAAQAAVQEAADELKNAKGNASLKAATKLLHSMRRAAG